MRTEALAAPDVALVATVYEPGAGVAAAERAVRPSADWAVE